MKRFTTVKAGTRGPVRFINLRDEWDRLVAETGGPVLQAWDWGEAKRFQGSRVWRAVTADGVAVQAVGVRRRGVPLAWAAGGPIVTTDTADPGASLRLIARALGRPLLVAPHDRRVGEQLAAAGLLRVPVGGYLPATIILDLTATEEDLRRGLHGKWRNQLSRAERSGIVVEVHRGASEAFEGFARLLHSEADRLGFEAPDRDELEILARTFGTRFLLYAAMIPGDLQPAALAAVLHGPGEALLLALPTRAELRGANAANAALFAAIRDARRRGLRRFDLGGIDPTASHGVARFKRRTGGREVAYPGVFAALPAGRWAHALLDRLARVAPGRVGTREDRDSPARLTWVGVEPTPYLLGFQREAVERLGLVVDVVYDREGDTQTWASLPDLPYEVVRRRSRGFGLPLFLARMLMSAPDVVIVEGWATPSSIAAIAVARLRRRPYLVSSDTPTAASTEGSLRSRLRGVVLPGLLRQAAGLIAAGTPQARHFVELGADPGRVTVVPMTVDVDAIRTAARAARRRRSQLRARWGLDERPVALFVGRLIPRKGVATLIEALRVLDGRFAGLVVGDGPERPRLEALARGLPVAFTGRLEGSDLWEAYGAADVFVLPSAREPWGLVVNEAMAAGLPVVASEAVGCVEDLVRGAGRVVPVGDPRALAEALLALDDETVRRRTVELQDERLREWTYEVAVERLRSVIEDAVGR